MLRRSLTRLEVNTTFRVKDIIDVPAPSMAALPENLASLKFGKLLTTYAVHADWNAATGWGRPYFVPSSSPLLIPQSSAGIHYGFSCYEGLKAYRSERDDQVRLFRPDMNA
eukprot:PhM_4_TR356/c0_g1_i1/m.63620